MRSMLKQFQKFQKISKIFSPLSFKSKFPTQKSDQCYCLLIYFSYMTLCIYKKTCVSISPF